jgi:hypothetical protein
MENERAEWKTLQAEQTIELDVIRTALAETQTASATTKSAVERGVELQRGQWTNWKEGPQVCQGGKVGGSYTFLFYKQKHRLWKNQEG